MHDDDAIAAADQNTEARALGAARPRWAPLAPLARRTLPVALLVVALGFGTVLRLDALTGRFGLVSGPNWLRALQSGSQTLVRILNPPVAGWQAEPLYPHQYGPSTHYRSDPYTYLKRAREMSSFYGAHYREPVFPFVVKGYLWLLNDQDVAVSFASATFSLLCVLATYFMGALAFSRWVGGAAALGLAIEREAISWGVSGWRDDTFAFAVALSACAMLCFRRKPSTGRAVALGACGAFAVLTRFFSVTFLAPGLLYLLLRSAGSWRDRSRAVMIATATLAVLVLPYLVNCWRVYGDPLYTLNYQPLYYLASEGAQPSTSSGAIGYIGGKLLRSPFQTLDTAAFGMTSYPFMNKWGGFEPWLPGLGHGLAVAAVLGLVMFPMSRRGRLLLLVLATAQIPFAFTWQLSADWRYTAFTYPFFLLAAGLVIVNVAAFATPSRWRRLAAQRPSREAVWALALTLGGIAVVAWMMLRVFPVMIFRETLLAKRGAVIVAGPRDSSFFKGGWSDRITTFNVTARVARGERSVVDIPLSRAADYHITVRLDPFPPPSEGANGLPSVRILFNGVLLRTVALTWDPEKVGSYDLLVRRALVRPGRNRLVFAGVQGVAADAAPGDRRPGSGFKLWYVLVAESPQSAQ
jgi:4-amino-4-deoxy-L-arabinose transferase-like glycosyltransferase